MVGNIKMTNKIIKVGSCAECPYVGYIQDKDNPCKAFIECMQDDISIETVVEEYYNNKTIHPDCPLEQDSSDINVATATAYDSGYEAGRQDATKHIRAVWEKYKDEYDITEFPSTTLDLWQAIRADIEGGGK
tara:strand:+ start:10032 stop:10427 length:396 start_codon:yes stop_codon:yes gene_type:complete